MHHLLPKIFCLFFFAIEAAITQNEKPFQRGKIIFRENYEKKYPLEIFCLENQRTTLVNKICFSTNVAINIRLYYNKYY